MENELGEGLKCPSASEKRTNLCQKDKKTGTHTERYTYTFTRSHNLSNAGAHTFSLTTAKTVNSIIKKNYYLHSPRNLA